MFATLGKTRSNKVARSELPINVAMRFDRIETGNGPSFFHGFDAVTGEAVAVRMMTVDEGMAVAGKKAEQDPEGTRRMLEGQYRGDGEKHRPRPSEISNPAHKTHCAKGGLLMFTRVLKNEDGTYRAHWVETLEREPGSGCELVTAHVRAEPVVDRVSKEVKSWTVAADVIDTANAVIATKENILPTLLAAYAEKADVNGQEVRRRPFVVARLIDSATGAMLLNPARVAAAQVIEKAIDHDGGGQEYDVRNTAPAEESVKAIFNPESTSQDALAVRAMVFGLGEAEGYPDWSKGGKEHEADLNKIVDGVRDGSLTVEIIPGERISAGPATRSSLVKDADKKHHPLNMFWSKKNDKGWVVENGRRFLPTYVTTAIGKDGYRLFTKAVLADAYPKLVSLKDIATVNDLKASAAAANERAAEAGTVDLDSDVPYDPAAIDPEAQQQVDAKLASAAAAMDEPA